MLISSISIFPALTLISRQMKNNTDKNNTTFGTIPANYFYILYYVNIWFTFKSKCTVIIIVVIIYIIIIISHLIIFEEQNNNTLVI